MNKIVKKILTGLLVILVGIQFIRIDKTNPESDPQADFISKHQPPAELAKLIRLACYDCHSHHTEYPWYTNIAPFSFWIKDHINHARKHLNFSTWTSYAPKRAHHKLEECYEKVDEGHMPLPSFLWMHPEAKLTPEQRNSLANWFKGQMDKIEL